ncbi:MAG: SMC-Scp complex subunit ScpB [Promethearchaeota archaeon]
MKRVIEAALFTSRKILSLKEITQIFPKSNKNEILQLIHELIEEYNNIQTALEIVELSNNRFELRIKNYILNSIDKFAHRNLLKKSDIKTLATIAYLQPKAERKNLYELLGKSSSIYNSIRRLKNLKFIIENNKKFDLTQKFYDYFQLNVNNPNIIKEQVEKNLLYYE